MMIFNKILEQFRKSVKRFCDKNCGKTQELEQFVRPSETKTALAILLGLALVFLTNISHAKETQTAQEVLGRCWQEGASTLVDELLKDQQQGWEGIVEQIATGDDSWIEASACLANGLYFSLNDKFDYALSILMEAWAQALTKNPKALLERDRSTSLAMICSLPLDYRDKSIEFADNFLQNALAAIGTVEEEHLLTSKKACQLYLAFDHERFVKQFKEYKGMR